MPQAPGPQGPFHAGPVGPPRSPVPPSAWGVAGMPPAPSGRPSHRRRSWVGPVAAVAILAMLAGGVLILVRSSEDDDERAGTKASGAQATTTLPPTTTIPRVTQVELLEDYCNAPGLKWPEVPRHLPGEPDRAYTKVMDTGLANASDTGGFISPDSASSLGGSTVISPQTDNVFIDDPSVLARTRSVACVTFVGTEGTGLSCDYTGGSLGSPFSRVTVEMAQNRFAITVYELHSGGILHKGEILTRSGGCPEWAVTDEGNGKVAWGLTDQDVLAWFDSHFVGGQPA